AFIRPANAASLEIECLSVIAIAGPAGSIARAKAIRACERRRSASPESRRFKSKLVLCASAPNRLERPLVNFELLALPALPYAH
ncbi:MAG: hypothetical protein ACRECN_04225, partial [Methylocella sp.]